MNLRCGRFELSLGRPLVMGVVNVTPDSFSDGGRYLDPEAAISHARRLIDDELVEAHRARALNPDAPVIRGTAQNPDVFFQAREACNPFYAAVPGIVFLSGGQSDEAASAHLSEMNRIGGFPWEMSFSYGRALQAPALKAWSGKKENFAAGQKAFYHRAKCNGAAVDIQFFFIQRSERTW